MLIKILVVIILIVVNGMFSATEMAFLSIGKYELNQDIKNKNLTCVGFYFFAIGWNFL